MHCVTFSPDGLRIASGSYDMTARVWNAVTGAEVICLRGHEFGVFSIAYSADGKRLATGSGDRTVRIWGCDRCRRAILPAQAHGVCDQRGFFPQWPLARDRGASVRLWDVATRDRAISAFRATRGCCTQRGVFSDSLPFGQRILGQHGTRVGCHKWHRAYSTSRPRELGQVRGFFL